MSLFLASIFASTGSTAIKVEGVLCTAPKHNTLMHSTDALKQQQADTSACRCGEQCLNYTAALPRAVQSGCLGTVQLSYLLV